MARPLPDDLTPDDPVPPAFCGSCGLPIGEYMGCLCTRILVRVRLPLDPPDHA